MELRALAPETTALLIVDIQEKLLPAMPAHDGARMVASASLLLDAALRFGARVLVTEQYPRGLGRTVASLQAQLEAASPRPAIVEKTVFSAAAPHEITHALTESHIRDVIVVGAEAHVCVYQTTRDLRLKGYGVHLPFDAVASRDPGCKSTALALLAQSGARITSSETLVFEWLGDAKNEHFKALSARVKDLPLPR